MFSAIGRADKFNNENGREREETKKKITHSIVANIKRRFRSFW